MEKKHSGADENDIWLCEDEPQPSKRTKRKPSELDDNTDLAHISTLEPLNRPIIDQGLIYAGRLGARTARILVLHPGSTSEGIKCDLKQKEDLTNASLGEVLPYEALSYTWGEEKDPGSIALCGYTFAVTRNLLEALRYLRYPDCARMLWVDAICINQYDEKEKEAQVLSMHMIYKFAKKVIAWLGPPNDATRLAYSSMYMMQKQDSQPVSAMIAIQISKDGIFERDDAFGELMGRDYWSRAWIVQEMMFAQSLVIQCGSEVVPYATLKDAHPHNKPAMVWVSSEDSDPVPISFRGDPEVKILSIDSQQMCSKQYLDCFLDRKCRERRDSIFAFFNLLSDDIQRRIQVCFKTDIRKLVRITARAIIKSTQSLHIIVIKGRQKPPSAEGPDKWQLYMPSWCPYFATPYECCAIEPQIRPSLFAEKAIYSFVNNRVRVRGFVIGRVSQLILRQPTPEGEVTAWWNEADIKRERKHYMKCIGLGLHGMPEDLHIRQMSIEATTRTLLVGQDKGVSGVQIILERKVRDLEEPAVIALRKIWHNGKLRSVCSFRLSKGAIRALSSSDAAPTAWINRIALVPHTVRQEDTICAILGCTTPVVLRKVGTCYRVLGEAYMDTSVMGSFRVVVSLRDFMLE